jgi:hypothetical protein
MSLYVKHIGKKAESDDRDKLPLGYLGATMVSHGQDFAPDSEFGSCLSRTANALSIVAPKANYLQDFGRANEAIARRQEAYVGSATGIWLESLERSLAQLKEYQVYTMISMLRAQC